MHCRAKRLLTSRQNRITPDSFFGVHPCCIARYPQQGMFGGCICCARCGTTDGGYGADVYDRAIGLLRLKDLDASTDQEHWTVDIDGETFLPCFILHLANAGY